MTSHCVNPKLSLPHSHLHIQKKINYTNINCEAFTFVLVMRGLLFGQNSENCSMFSYLFFKQKPP